LQKFNRNSEDLGTWPNYGPAQTTQAGVVPRQTPESRQMFFVCSGYGDWILGAGLWVLGSGLAVKPHLRQSPCRLLSASAFMEKPWVVGWQVGGYTYSPLS